MIKILIADDHAVVRQGLKQIITDEKDMQVAGEAENAAQVLRLVGSEKFNVVILDITMPGGKSGLDLLPEIKALRPMIKILILSMHAEEQFAVRALKSGASGYITKQSAPTELVRAIRKVQSGGKYISQSIAEQLAFFYSDDAGKPPHEKLSDREFQVTLMIAEGKTLREIADALYISEKTVGTYRVRILEKMNMNRNAELIRYAVQNKLIE
ncbi:MAG: response regulator [Pyrinomonadaceae bacterium]